MSLKILTDNIWTTEAQVSFPKNLSNHIISCVLSSADVFW